MFINLRIFKIKSRITQESIPVGCVPPVSRSIPFISGGGESALPRRQTCLTSLCMQTPLSYLGKCLLRDHELLFCLCISGLLKLEDLAEIKRA